jgi:hypothetical protein
MFLRPLLRLSHLCAYLRLRCVAVYRHDAWVVVVIGRLYLELLRSKALHEQLLATYAPAALVSAQLYFLRYLA